MRLLRPAALPANWDPSRDPRLTAWEMVHQLIRALEDPITGSEAAAAALVVKLGSKSEIARELAYRLYALCERKKRAAKALSYNGLVQSWPEITRLAREVGKEQQATFIYYWYHAFPVNLRSATVGLDNGKASLSRTLGEIELARMNQPAEEFREEERADDAADRADTAVGIGSVGGKRAPQRSPRPRDPP